MNNTKTMCLTLFSFLLASSSGAFSQTAKEIYQYPDLHPATLVNGELTVYCIHYLKDQKMVGKYQASLRPLNDSFPFKFESTQIVTSTSNDCDQSTFYSEGSLTGTVLVKGGEALIDLPYKYILTLEKVNQSNNFEFIVYPENLYKIIEGLKEIKGIQGHSVQTFYQGVSQNSEIELRDIQSNDILTSWNPIIKDNTLELTPTDTGIRSVELVDHTARQIDYFTITVNASSVTPSPISSCGGTNEEPCVNNESKQIVLNGTSISTDSEKVTVNQNGAVITSVGTYTLTGSLNDGQIIIDAEDEATVTLILNGAHLNSSKSAPLFIRHAKTVILILAEGTENSITDEGPYTFDNVEETEPDATLFSKSDLIIRGKGSLSVDAHYNDGIKSKDGLTIAGGQLTVHSVNDGIQGKDYLVVTEGEITVEANSDGLKSTHDEESSLGYVSIQGGQLNIISGGDAIQAETYVTISDGILTLTSGGGSDVMASEDPSAKGIKANTAITVEGGTFSIHSADDAIHANETVTINKGDFTISSGDDGIHADSTLAIHQGQINILKAYEGIESASITLNDGTIHIVSEDDGINGAGGVDQSSPGQFRPPVSGNYALYIHGGYIVVDSNGDGLDINGFIVMTNGIVIVNGPTSNGNGAIDYDASFNISGGYLLAVGSSGMAQAPSRTSTQYSLLVNLNSPLQAGTLIHIETSEGEEIVTFAPNKKYQSIAFSSAKLLNGSSYDVYYGGNSTGGVTDGLYEGGVYTLGTKYTGLTISSVVTTSKGNR